MDKLTALRIYSTVYRAAATQLATGRDARGWMETMVDYRAATREQLEAHAAQSARWASAGYMPGEAQRLIADGVTPETANELDDLAVDIAGGPDERAAQRIDELVRDGVLVDPARVVQTQDPDDPYHTIITIY